jgi:hypothetical protein
MGTAWPGCGIDHPPLSSAEVKERVVIPLPPPPLLHGMSYGELYLLQVRITKLLMLYSEMTAVCVCAETHMKPMLKVILWAKHGTL